MRRRYFPPERNHVPAHLTLFHTLPGDEHRRIGTELAALAARTRPFAIASGEIRDLGNGVAITFPSPEIVRLRQALMREWADWLTPQDSAPIQPHVTIQNKVAPREAKTLLTELRGTLAPIRARAEGFLLWRYLGGPWERIRMVPFLGRTAKR